MNKIYIFLSLFIMLVTTSVKAQDLNQSIIDDRYPNEHYLIDDFDYIQEDNNIFLVKNNLNSSPLFENSTLIRRVFKVDGQIFLNPSSSTSAKISSKEVFFYGSGDNLNKYYWRFRFKIKGNNGYQSSPKIIINYSDGSVETKTIDVVVSNIFLNYDVEVELGNKDIKGLSIEAETSSNGYFIDEILVFTDAPLDNTTTFNGNTWTLGEPNYNIDAVFEGNFNFNQNLQAKSLKIKNGSNVIVTSGNKINLLNQLTVEEGAVLHFKEKSYLIQINDDATNIGDVSFDRSSKPMYRYGTNTWSSPVYNQNIFAFSPGTITTRFYNYITSDDSWSNANINSSSTFERGIGYGIYAPNNFPNYNNGTNEPRVFTSTFNGVPINGNFSITLDHESSGKNQYLIGNPYPSPISLKALLYLNEGFIDNVSLYTHEVPVDNYLGVYASKKSHYLTINQTGIADSESYSYLVDLGQAFFIKISDDINSDITIDFMNYFYRYEEDGMIDFTEQPFYYRANLNERVEDKFWLTLRKENEKLGSALIGFSDNSTDDFDAKYDAKGIDASTKIGVFSQLNDENYIIQSFASFNDERKVLLSFRTPEIGEYTIDLDKLNGLFENQNIYLKDKLLNQVVDLTEQLTYNFSSEGEFNSDRFEIQFKENLALNNFENTAIEVYTFNRDLFIKLDSKLKASYNIYDSSGKLICKDNFIQDTSISNLHNGMYIVVVDDSVQKFTKKIIIK